MSSSKSSKSTTKIVGTKGDDVLTGTGGNDSIKGRAGDDTLLGGAGNDKLKGKSGNDTITGGAGNDTIDGGTGRDIAVFSGKFSDYNITFRGHDGGDHDDDDDDHKITVADRRPGHDGTDTLKSIEVLRFSDGEYRDGHFYPSNIAPVAPAQSAAATEGGASVTVNALGTATDVNNDPLTVVNVPTTLPPGVSYNATTHSFTIDPGNIAYDSLSAGATQTIVVTYGVFDGTATTATSVSFNITGTNDAATVSSVSVALDETNAPLSTGGTLVVSDADTGEAHTVAQTAITSYGAFAINTNGAWTYTANGAHNELAASQVVTEVFAVQSQDGTGSGTVTITITGTNDAAVLSSATANLTETDAVLSTGGTLTVNDVDSPQTFVVQAGTAGNYGTFTINAAGAWTYTAASAHDEFVAGTTYTDTFAVASADGTATSVTVNILGTDDLSVLSSATANLTEGNTAVDISTAGTLALIDPDSATTFVAQDGTPGSYGTFAIGTDGAWTYIASSAHDEFAAGTTYTDTFSVAADDGTTTSVTVNIAGTNDAPVAVADSNATDAVVESGVVQGVGVVAADGLVGTWLTTFDPVNEPFSAISLFADGRFMVMEGAGESPNGGQAGTWVYDAAASKIAFYVTYDNIGGGAGLLEQNGIFNPVAFNASELSVTVTHSDTGAETLVLARQPVGAGIQGTWLQSTVDEPFTALTLLADNRFMYMEGAGPLPNGLEAGTYAYDASTGLISFNTTFDRNNDSSGFGGLSPTLDGLSIATTLNGDTLTVNVGDLSSQPLSRQGGGMPIAIDNVASAGDPMASGNVLTNDTDIDLGDGKSVSAVNGLAGNVGTSVAGTYGSLAIAGDGSYTYTLNNADTDTNALSKDEAASDVFTYTMQDAAGATSSATLTIGITGTNDAPVISGSMTGAVTEDSNVQPTGHLVATDPDHGAEQFWSVAGGEPAQAADYHFRAESFTVIRSGITLLDTFSDGLPPPNSPILVGGLPTSYGVLGGFDETNGKLLLDSDNAVLIEAPGTPDPFIGQSLTFRSNIDPANTSAGLKINASFSINGVFDLIAPDSPRELYGIRASDRLVGGTGTPPDQLGDEDYVLAVRQNPFGQNLVTLRRHDFVADVTTNLQSIALNPLAGADQILLTLNHAANSSFLSASFQYMSNGSALGAVQTFSSVADMFGTAADLNTADGIPVGAENWVRAGIIAYAPQFTDSNLGGTFGSLNINQTGDWTYSLNNALASTQSLARGQTATDTFAVQLHDEFGATDTTNVNITVTGTNDAPLMQTASTSRVFTEDGATPDLTATGLAQFSDVDLTDAHTTSAVLSSSVLSGGGALPAGLATLLGSAMTAHVIDPSVGDGHGQIEWDFALANSATQFLAAGQTLALQYKVTATDTFGATAIQTIDVTVTGTNDAPTVFVPDPAPTPTLDIVVANLQSDSVGVLAGDGVGGFAAAAVFPSAGSAPYSATLGDVNRDGFLDIVAANATSGRVSVLPGNGAGGFAAAATHSTGGSNPNTVVLGDVNGDGFLDIVTPNVLSNTVAVLRGDGAGGFAPVTTFGSGGAFSMGAALGDVNGDGFLDIAVANLHSNNVGVLKGDGAGGFAAAVSFYSGGSATSVAMGDVNRDGSLDIVVTNFYSGTVGVLAGNGTGGFATAVTYSTGASNSRGLALGDVNGDSLLDIVTANEYSATVSVLTGNGAGGFATAVSLASGGSTSAVALGDVNDDGRLDIVTSNFGSDNVGVLAGNGAGGFSTPAVFGTGGAFPYSVALGNVVDAASLSYTENQAATAISGALVLADVDSSNLAGAKVSITGHFHAAEDVLGFSNTASITGNYNAATGVMTLTGSDTLAAYQAALRSVTYFNSSEDPSGDVRTVSYQVDDGAGANHASNIAIATVSVTAVADAPNVGIPVFGSPFADVLSGTSGDDLIIGLGGSDNLTGGAGADHFVYNSINEGTDTITDFTRGAGGDVLELQNLLSSVGAPHNSAAFSAGYLQFAQTGSDTVVQVDSDGGGDSFVNLAILTNQLLTQADTANYVL